MKTQQEKNDSFERVMDFLEKLVLEGEEGPKYDDRGKLSPGYRPSGISRLEALQLFLQHRSTDNGN